MEFLNLKRVKHGFSRRLVELPGEHAHCRVRVRKHLFLAFKLLGGALREMQ
jgi:hypothetical protein